MRALPDDPRLAPVRQLADRTPGLRLLLLFGSRVMGTVHERSDWDLAYLADDRLDVPRFFAELTLALRTDDVDLADLDRAGAVLRFAVADQGARVFPDAADEHERFWWQAVHFWCDAGPIIRREQAAQLAAL